MPRQTDSGLSSNASVSRSRKNLVQSLSEELYHQCRDVLLRCEEFTSIDQLKSVFITDDLSPFRNRLKDADSMEKRVDLNLSYLLSKRIQGGRSVLLIFLKVLCDRYPTLETIHIDLADLYAKMQAILEPEEALPINGFAMDTAASLPRVARQASVSDPYVNTKSDLRQSLINLAAKLENSVEKLDSNDPSTLSIRPIRYLIPEANDKLISTSQHLNVYNDLGDPWIYSVDEHLGMAQDLLEAFENYLNRVENRQAKGGRLISKGRELALALRDLSSCLAKNKV